MKERHILLVIAICNAGNVLGDVGFGRPPPPFYGVPPYKHPPPIPPPPPASPDSSCSPTSRCTSPRQCRVQCIPGWESLDSASCYHIRQRAAASTLTWTQAQEQCRALAAVGNRPSNLLPVLEGQTELSRLATRLRSPAWLAAQWDASASAWIWASSGDHVNFAALGRQSPTISGATGSLCLVLTPGGELRSSLCEQTRLGSLVCETGSSSVARCGGERLCCAVPRRDLGQDCFVDNAGTRCEQRVSEGYFLVDDENLVRVSAANNVQSWHGARDVCRRSGGDLAVINSRKFNDRLADLLRPLIDDTTTLFYIGLSSDNNAVFMHVNGEAVAGGFVNFASVADSRRATACAHVSESGVWSTEGACSERRRYICHIGPLRRRLTQRVTDAVKCGQRKLRGVFGKASHAGRKILPHALHDRAQFAEFPWQAAIWVRKGVGLAHQFTCSGALLKNDWVLMPTHCVNNINVSDIRVTLGDWNLDGDIDNQLLPVLVRNVSQIRTSPDLFYGSSGSVTLVKLSPTLNLSSVQQPHISPVCLPELSDLFTTHHCVATGWQRSKPAYGSPYSPYQYQQQHHNELLRKLETPGADFDPVCQHLAQFIHHRQTLYAQPPFYDQAPITNHYGFPRASQQSDREEIIDYDSDLADSTQARSKFFLPHPPPVYNHPPPYFPPAFQPSLPPKLCLRDPRCINDPGVVLICAVSKMDYTPHYGFRHGTNYGPTFRVHDSPRSSVSVDGDDEYEENDEDMQLIDEDDTKENHLESLETLRAFVRTFHPPTSPTKVKRDTSNQGEPSTTPAASDTTSTASNTDSLPPASSEDDLPQARTSGDSISQARSLYYNQPPFLPHPPRFRQIKKRYVIMGLATKSANRCDLRPMVFDNVLTQTHFIRSVIDQ